MGKESRTPSVEARVVETKRNIKLSGSPEKLFFYFFYSVSFFLFLSSVSSFIAFLLSFYDTYFLLEFSFSLARGCQVILNTEVTVT